jgi:Ion transport protein
VRTGFSGAFYILFTPPHAARGAAAADVPASFADFQSTLLSTFVMIFGDIDLDALRESPHPNMAIVMFCLYQVAGLIVLLNLLIAIMGDTFNRVKEMEALHFWKGRCAPAPPAHRVYCSKFVCA